MNIGRIRVLFVCYGNICRSPMAEFVFKDIVEAEGLSDRFDIASAGTSGEHIGDSPDRRAAATLARHGISCEGKRSRRLLLSDFVDYDYVVCMDRMNMDYIVRMSPGSRACESAMLMSYAGGGEVADPYYTGDFEKAFSDISRGCRGLLDHIMEEHPELGRWGRSARSCPSRSRTAGRWIRSGGTCARPARGRPRPSRRT